MTFKEWKSYFTEWQREHQRIWKLDKNGHLYTSLYVYVHGKRDGDWRFSCPITAPFLRPSRQYLQCGAALKLDIAVIYTILYASDMIDDYNADLRIWLLKTCGVKEAA